MNNLRAVVHRRALAGLAVAAAGALALAGCSGSGQGAATGSSAKLTSLSIMAPFLTTNAPAEGNEIQKALEKSIGVSLKINWVPNASYEDKTNITLAGDSIPQVMVIQGKTPGFVKNAQAGAFWDLTSYLPDYPNLKTTSPDVQAASSINGKVFGIYRARDTMREGVIIRKDWLQKLGLSVPKTVDDLYKIADAFTNDDPDGNGVKDTYGLIIPKWPGGIGSNSPYDAIETWFGAGNGWKKSSGGKLEPSFMQPEWLKAVQFEKKLVSDGLVNPDYATFDSAKWNEPFLNGKGGIIIDVQSRAAVLMSLLKEKDPAHYQDYIEITGNLESPSGTLNALPTAGYSGFLAIPKTQVRTAEQLRGVLAVLNKMNSPEAGKILNNGIEGQTYTVQDKLAVAVPGVSPTLKDDVSSYAQLGTNVTGFQGLLPKQASDYEQQMYDKRLKIQDSDLAHAVFNPAAPYVSDTYTAQGAQLDTIVSDARIQYIAGQIDEKGLTDAIARWRSSGGDAVISEINKLYKANSK
ncbi:extracellular solute-binding protein [Microbacterium panaciterrae]|uniref:Extracellular solute-binding protein n=1 Tax=Microbacterium panaciterrae TaxID=985759 RepID=A0ABP8PKX8_9MICO